MTSKKKKHIIRKRKIKKYNSEPIDLRKGGFLAFQVLLILIMAFSLWKIREILLDQSKSNDFSRELQEFVILTDIKDVDTETKARQIALPPEENAVPQAVDFNSLYEISRDAAAWLYAPNGDINYVVAQAEDNDYYLHHLLDGTAANSGTLFIDCHNSSDFSDWNTVIYGHNMKNGTMFASLLEYRNPAYYEAHPIMYLYTPENRYKIELIAGFTTSTEDIIYQFPSSKQNRDKILQHAYHSSSFISGITVEAEDKLVTLSTCSYTSDNSRYVVIGRLIKE